MNNFWATYLLLFWVKPNNLDWILYLQATLYPPCYYYNLYIHAYRNGIRIHTWGSKLKTKKKKKKKLFISYSTKYYIQNKYFLKISYYKTYQQSITYKISVSYFVHNFYLVHIYFILFYLQLKGHEFYLFISFLVGQYLYI